MPPLHRNTPSPRVTLLIDRIELALIAAMAILLPFDHWFFGHIVNPAPMRVLGFILTAVWLLRCLTGHLHFRFERWHGFLLLFLAACFYSAIAGPPVPRPEINTLQYKLVATFKIVAAMLFLVLACQALTLEKLKFFLKIHLINGTVICTASLALYFLHLYGIWPYNFALWVDEDIYNFVRIQGVSFEPQRFGAYVLTLLPFFLSHDARKKVGWPCSQLDTLWLVIILATLILSYAISTYLVLPIMLLLMFITAKKKLRRLVWVFTGMMAMTALLLSIPAVRDATVEIIIVKMRGQSFTTRLHNWEVAKWEYRMYPWTGVGPENYSYVYPYFDHSVTYATPATHPPHSIFFGLLANLGLPGIITFFAMMTAFGVSLIRRFIVMRQDRNLAYTLAVIALVHFLIQFTIWLPWSLNQWLYMALAWAAAQSSSTSATSAPRPHHVNV